MAPEVSFPNLGIEFEHVNRVAVSVFGRPIYWYGVLIGLGMVLALLLVFYEAKRTGQSVDEYLDFAIVTIILSVIGARLYYIVFSWNYYRYNLNKLFSFREGGLAIYGAVLTGILCGFVYSRWKKKDFWLMADTVLPSLLLGQIIGRWGNFFNKEAFGGSTDSLFAMRLMKDSVYMMPESMLNEVFVLDGVEYIQVHPTFFYEFLWGLILFIILILIRVKYKQFNGQVGALYAIGYGLGRFWIEGLRTDQLLLGHTDIAVSQVVSALMVLGGLGFYLWRRQLNKKEAGQTEGQ